MVWRSDVCRTISALAGRFATERSRLLIAWRVLRKKPIPIRLFGDEHVFAVYQAFTARHPRFPFVQRKTFGAALRDLNIPRETLFDGPHFTYLRRKVRRAEKLGYRVVPIDPSHYLDQIMRIHASGPVRQGRVMQADYLDRNKVSLFNTKPGPWYGVLDPEGTLQAYCHLPVIGDCCAYSRILGNAGKLDHGIMYLLIYYTVTRMHHLRITQGHPTWVMYDMFLGGLEGLREFKRRAGFSPERVTWVWVERDTQP
jgi:hypothetical protein